MTFLAILLLGFIAFALMWLLGLHIKFELTFKTLATVFVVLPLLVIPALLVFVDRVWAVHDATRRGAVAEYS